MAVPALNFSSLTSGRATAFAVSSYMAWRRALLEGSVTAHEEMKFQSLFINAYAVSFRMKSLEN
jgi:hypothetical protein